MLLNLLFDAVEVQFKSKHAKHCISVVDSKRTLNNWERSSLKDDKTQLQWLHSFWYKTPYLSVWQKAEAGAKHKGLCSHCSPWPPTKGPLQRHSPWNDQATSPPRLHRSTETAGPNTSCPSPKRLSNSVNTLNIDTLEETGACYSAASKPKLFHSHPR